MHTKELFAKAGFKSPPGISFAQWHHKYKKPYPLNFKQMTQHCIQNFEDL